MGEFHETEQIQPEDKEEGYPEREERFAVEDMPAISQVGNRQEFEGECQFHEAEAHLHGVEPAATLGCAFQQGGEEREEGERQGQCEGEAEHADGGRKCGAAAGAHLNEQETDNRTGAGETHERQRERHEEDAEQARGLLGLAVDRRAPRGRQRNLETAKETGAEHHEHQEEEYVEDGIRGEVVEGGSPKDGGDNQAEGNIDYHD